MKCSECENVIEHGTLLACVSCKKPFHYQCLKMTTPDFIANIQKLRRGWMCVSCNNVNRRRRADNTPVRPQPRDMSFLELTNMSCDEVADASNCSVLLVDVTADPPGNPANVEEVHNAPMPAASSSRTLGSIGVDEFNYTLSVTLDDKFGTIKNQLSQELTQHLEDIKSEFYIKIDSLKENVISINGKLECLQKENQSLRKELDDLKASSPPNNELLDTVTQLRTELNEREQASLTNDVELTNIPEAANESVGHVVLTMASMLGVAVEERDLVYCERVGARRPAEVPAPGAQADGAQQKRMEGPAGPHERPRPIVVRFARRALRDELLKSARVHRGAKTGNFIPTKPSQQFYINERLTRTNRVIFGRARKIAKLQGWQYVWTKDGRVQARKADKGRVYWLRAVSDIPLVFGTDSLPLEK